MTERRNDKRIYCVRSGVWVDDDGVQYFDENEMRHRGHKIAIAIFILTLVGVGVLSLL